MVVMLLLLEWPSRLAVTNSGGQMRVRIAGPDLIRIMGQLVTVQAEVTFPYIALIK